MFNLVNKPKFSEGDLVTFQVDDVYGCGTIRGKLTESAIDVWLVEVDFNRSNISPEMYPYSTIGIPHICLKPVIKNSCDNATPR